MTIQSFRRWGQFWSLYCVAMAACVALALLQLPARGDDLRETPDFLSHDQGRRTFDLLPGDRAGRRADAPPATTGFPRHRGCSSRSSPTSDRYHLVAPDYPGFGHSDWPDPKAFNYTFDHIASVMNDSPNRWAYRITRSICRIMAARWASAWRSRTRSGSTRLSFKTRSRTTKA